MIHMGWAKGVDASLHKRYVPHVLIFSGWKIYPTLILIMNADLVSPFCNLIMIVDNLIMIVNFCNIK